MFYDRFVQICKEKGVSPSRAAIDAGLSKSTVSKWKNQPDAEPSGSAIKKLSDYFGISKAELLDEQKNTPVLTRKDERDIAHDLERLRESLESGDSLMFDGNPMSKEARESILQAMELGLRVAKQMNKETYTPKKYRKD